LPISVNAHCWQLLFNQLHWRTLVPLEVPQLCTSNDLPLWRGVSLYIPPETGPPEDDDDVEELLELLLDDVEELLELLLDDEELLLELEPPAPQFPTVKLRVNCGQPEESKVMLKISSFAVPP
jgi:hypothetical protein